MLKSPNPSNFRSPRASGASGRTIDLPNINKPPQESPYALASPTRKNFKVISGLEPLQPTYLTRPPQSMSIKTSPDEDEREPKSPRFESPSSPQFFYGRPVKLTRLRNTNVHSLDYATSNRKLINPEDMDDSEEFRKKLVTPLRTEKLISEDESPKNVMGEKAVTNFYSHYKMLDKIKDMNHFTQIQDSTYTSFLGKSENLKLLPSKIGFIKEKGEADKLKLNHYRLGDKYAEVLSEGLKSMRGCNALELANNRLTEVGANHVLSKLTYLTEYVNLSGNSIGKMGCEHLVSIISLKNSRIIELNLEGNKLGDNCIGQLCDAIAYNDSIKKLKIGKNFLSDNVAERISKMLEMNSTLEELYIQWNQIKSVGGATIVNGLKSANHLKILDFSWNSLGLNGSHFAKAFGSYIATNTTLAHLDLSNNYINKADAKIIAEDLKSNHTLYGFHFAGNCGFVDFKGFLVIPDDWESEVAGRIIQPPIDSAKYQSESLKHHIGNFSEYKDVCWICEGWRPMNFAWEAASGPSVEQDPLYVHLSFEGYKSVFLALKNDFRNTRMVPPVKFDYFFSLEGEANYAMDQPAGKPDNFINKMKIEGEERDVKVEIVNKVEKGQPGKILDEDYDVIYELKELDIRPRVPDETYIPAAVIHQRPQWKFPISIFRNFRADTPQLLDDCFRVDFDGTRISKLVKNADDLANVREILHSVYKQLKDCYKYYAAVGAPSDIWSIPLNTYTDFCSSSGIIDGKVLKLSDFDRIFIATYTKSDKEKNHRNPDRALVRYQFLEGLLRIAEQKYLGSGQVSTYADAMNMLMDESVKPFIAKFNHHQFRPDRYWNEEVDTVYKSYLPIIRGIYKKYSGQKTLPGQKKFMCLEEFNRMMSDGGLYSDNCGERDATIAFSLGMMTQLDELNSDRIYQMQFFEFLEALARVAEKISAHPYGYIFASGSSPKATEEGLMPEIPYDQRFAQPLHVKLEGLMPLLFSLCGNDVKELWSLPEASIFTMEEVNGKVRFPTKKKKILRINPTHPNSIEPYDGFHALQI